MIEKLNNVHNSWNAIVKKINEIIENGGGGGGSFEPTPVQMDAINSGATVQKINQITTNQSNINSLDTNKQDKLSDDIQTQDLGDSNVLSSLDLATKKNKTWTVLKIFEYIWEKIKTTKALYKHHLVYYNNYAGGTHSYPMCWFDVINDQQNFTLSNLISFLDDNDFVGSANTYTVGAGGITSTLTVATPSGTSNVGQVFTGVYYDIGDSALKFKTNYNGYIVPIQEKFKIFTTKLIKE